MLRILSYNIWGKFGPYEERYHNIIRAVVEIDADIVCFQEAKDLELLGKIAKHTDSEVLIADTEQTGLAILSKFPAKQKKLVENALKSLPEISQQIIRLYFFEGKSLHEIERTFACSQHPLSYDQIRGRLNKLMKTLANELKELK